MATGIKGIRSITEILLGLGVEFWLDSGSLLGLIREGGEIEWDNDLDLGVWSHEVKKIQAIQSTLQRLGYRIHTRSYRGQIYGFTFKHKYRSRPALSPIHVHVYYKRGSQAWSPQTIVYKLPPARQPRELNINSRTRYLLASLQHRARGKSKGITRQFMKKFVYFPTWAGFVLIRNRFERQIWSSRWPFNQLYQTYTWLIPAHFFETLDAYELDACKVPIPSDVDAYLTLRYGDWRTPVQDWCYWQDDGCLVPQEPIDVPALQGAESVDTALETVSVR